MSRSAMSEAGAAGAAGGSGQVDGAEEDVGEVTVVFLDINMT